MDVVSQMVVAYVIEMLTCLSSQFLYLWHLVLIHRWIFFIFSCWLNDFAFMLVLLWGRQIWLLLQWRLAGSPSLSQGRWPSQQGARALSDESGLGLGSGQGQSLSRDFPLPRWLGGVWSWARRSGPGWRPGWWESRHRESCGAAVRGARGTAPRQRAAGQESPF